MLLPALVRPPCQLQHQPTPAPGFLSAGSSPGERRRRMWGDMFVVRRPAQGCPPRRLSIASSMSAISCDTIACASLCVNVVTDESTNSSLSSNCMSRAPIFVCFPGSKCNCIPTIRPSSPSMSLEFVSSWRCWGRTMTGEALRRRPHRSTLVCWALGWAKAATFPPPHHANHRALLVLSSNAGSFGCRRSPDGGVR